MDNKSKQFLLEPCQTADDLDKFIRTWLKLELPWDTTDQDSTSSPLKLIWSVYKTLMTGKGPSKHVVAASRNAAKTVSASVIQFLSLLHFRRDGVHIASILDQSMTAIRYLDTYMNIPELSEYRMIDNVRLKMFRNLPPNDYTTKSEAALRVVTATKKGANSPRASCFAGKTQVTIYRDTPRGKTSGRFSCRSMDGIFRRFNRGEKILVATVNPITGSIEPSEVTAVSRNSVLDRLVLETEDGLSIECTPDHWLASGYDEGGLLYRQAKDFLPGEELIRRHRPRLVSKTRITSIRQKQAKPAKRERWVYDIKVAKNHNFFANQVLVHNCLTLDEVDLTPPEIISEVAYIGDPTRDGHKFGPVFVYLSSRKTNDGPIQKLQDQAVDIKTNPDKRIKLHKWSQVDFMEACPPAIHKPEKGLFPAFIHTESLEIVWGKENYELGVPDSIKGQYKEISAFEGCKTCPAFVACQGRSAKQRGDSPMLRTREFVGDILDAVGDPAVIIAQSLNWKPESTAIVFKSFSNHKHVKTPSDFYEWAVGERFNPDQLSDKELDDIEENGTRPQLLRITPTKIDIYNGMCKSGWTIFSGVDWGYSPDPAVCVVAGFNKRTKRLAVIHVENALNHANHVWAQHVAEQIYPRMPFEYVGPDLADPASPTYFAKYKIRSLDYKPPRIETGVSFLRGLMWNPVTQQSSFAILDDSQDYTGKQELGREQGNWMLISAMQRWTHKKLTTGGWDMSKFEDNKWTHPIDALRYGLDPMIELTKIGISATNAPSELNLEAKRALGDPEAEAAMKAKETGIAQMNEFFKSEFGMGDVFKAEKALASQNPAEGKPIKPRGSTKFKF